MAVLKINYNAVAEVVRLLTALRNSHEFRYFDLKQKL